MENTGKNQTDNSFHLGCGCLEPIVGLIFGICYYNYKGWTFPDF